MPRLRALSRPLPEPRGRAGERLTSHLQFTSDQTHGSPVRGLDRDAFVYYITRVPDVRQTPAFAQWLDGLRDHAAVARINVRIRRLSLGNPGDVRSVGAGVSELRIDYGPGYRVYFVHRGPETIVLLCGGDKSAQDRDIGRAKELAKEDRDGS